MQASTKEGSLQNVYDVMQRACEKSEPQGSWKIINKDDLLSIITQVVDTTTYQTRKAYLDTLTYYGFIKRESKYGFYVMESVWRSSKLYADLAKAELVRLEASELLER